jgi:molybdopterin-containing oxidoreductase family iron-sulfur binding subunit
MADHRWPVRAADIPSVAAAMANAFGLEVSASLPAGLAAELFEAVIADVQGAGAQAVIVPGLQQSPEVHAIAAALNKRLGSEAVRYIQPVQAVTGAGSLSDLAAELAAGEVDLLVVLGGNPVYDAPSDLKFAELLEKVPTRVHLTREPNETSALFNWVLPMTHPLEEWGDLRAFDGTLSLVQPLIAPLFEGRSAIEVLNLLAGNSSAPYDLVKSTWQSVLPAETFEVAWRNVVHDGLLKNSAAPSVPVGEARVPASVPVAAEGVELTFRPDPTIFDGRYANNGWLQELPKPVTKLTWDNAAIMSLATAKQLGITHEDEVRITSGESSIVAVAFIQPGQPDNSVLLNLGYGRTIGGTVATARVVGNEYDPNEGGGFNAAPLRTQETRWIASGVKVEKTGKRGVLVTTQGHRPLPSDRITDERDILREATIQQFLRDPEELIPFYAFPEEEIKKNDMYVEEVFQWNGPQWGMTIDLNTCIGCNACVTACQAENNIPVVGKTQVGKGREMHWLKIDRYYKGDEVNPQATWQPLMCVHCEKAPCEPVCPVAATVHSHEGLNQMVYNRCVGTRYCSNNCPYKVRRFNYLNYTDNQPNFMTKVKPIAALLGNTTEEKQNGIQLLKMLNNPNVTVRGRGVMEKCTYCVQRINDARKEAKKGGREVADGEIITACEQACPTQAIVFGNIADKESRVAKLRKDPRAWMLLEELQTRPRTSHLAKLRNPNPAITPVPEPPRKRVKHGEEHGEGDHGGESHGGDSHGAGNKAHDSHGTDSHGEGGDHSGHNHDHNQASEATHG